MSKNVVVFGSGGQLGVELMRTFGSRGYRVTGFERAQVDITDGGAVDQAIASLDPAVVLNAAAYNQVDIAESEPQSAYQVNALAVRNIAMSCRQTGASLVHFSTDYVFDGKANRPYVETDSTHPLGAYAVSKLAGELYAQAYLDQALVVRTSGVFGPGGLHTARGNFVELMLRLARSNQPIRVVEDHVASPTFAPALAERTADLVEKRISGVIHLGGGEAVSWYDYARMIFEEAKLSPELRPTSEREYRTAARRPKYSALSNQHSVDLGIQTMPSLRDAVRGYLSARERETASV